VVSASRHVDVEQVENGLKQFFEFYRPEDLICMIRMSDFAKESILPCLLGNFPPFTTYQAKISPKHTTFIKQDSFGSKTPECSATIFL
jgi:hypothetical protein